MVVPACAVPVGVASAECNMAVFVTTMVSNIDQGHHGKLKMKSKRQLTRISTPPIWHPPSVRPSYHMVDRGPQMRSALVHRSSFNSVPAMPDIVELGQPAH